jgi:hypothetical protein
VPAVDGVKVVEQVASPGVMLAAKLQGLPVNDPTPPVAVRLTGPVGVKVPIAMSETVAVHDVACPGATVLGVHATVMFVVRKSTVMVVVPVLVACVVSPP